MCQNQACYKQMKTLVQQLIFRAVFPNKNANIQRLNRTLLFRNRKKLGSYKEKNRYKKDPNLKNTVRRTKRIFW